MQHVVDVGDSDGRELGVADAEVLDALLFPLRAIPVKVGAVGIQSGGAIDEPLADHAPVEPRTPSQIAGVFNVGNGEQARGERVGVEAAGL